MKWFSRVIPEAGARMMALRTGDIDVAMQPPPAELAVFKKDKNFTVNETMGMRIIYVGFHNEMGPTDDPRVRQALSMAVNVPAILENIMEGSAVAPKGYLAPAVFGFKDMELEKRFPYDPEKAKSLLAEAGWKDSDGDGFLDKDGAKLTVKFLGTKGRYPQDAEICEAVQAMWQEIGVNCTLEFFEWAATFTMLRAPELDYNVYCLGWVTTNRDADYSLYAMFHSGQFSPNGWNRNRFKNDRVDELLDKARSSQDREARKAMYAEVQGHPGRRRLVDSHLQHQGDPGHEQPRKGLHPGSPRVHSAPPSRSGWINRWIPAPGITYGEGHRMERSDGADHGSSPDGLSGRRRLLPMTRTGN